MKKRILLIFIFSIFFGIVPASAVQLSAESAILINGTTGTVLYEKNVHQRMPMASTTKIMTAVLLLETADLEETIVTTKEMVTVEGSSMGLLEGDTVSYKALLAGLMLSSGNDAANTIAISLAGSTEAFARMMNEKAQQLQMLDTHFVTPSGLDDDAHYTTAYDMALLAAYAMCNPEFCAVVSSQSATVQYGAPPYKRTLYNHNKLLDLYEGANGVKTGFTKKSGRCLVSSAQRDEELLIAVTLNAPDDWNDHTTLLDYGFSVLERKLISTQTTFSVPVVGGVASELSLYTEPFSVGLAPSEEQNITQTVYLPNFTYAPVDAGQIIGQVTYRKGDTVIATKAVVAAREIAQQDISTHGFVCRFLENIKRLLN